jgi:hypothetical protein
MMALGIPASTVNAMKVVDPNFSREALIKEQCSQTPNAPKDQPVEMPRQMRDIVFHIQPKAEASTVVQPKPTETEAEAYQRIKKELDDRQMKARMDMLAEELAMRQSESIVQEHVQIEPNSTTDKGAISPPTENDLGRFRPRSVQFRPKKGAFSPPLNIPITNIIDNIPNNQGYAGKDRSDFEDDGLFFASPHRGAVGEECEKTDVVSEKTEQRSQFLAKEEISQPEKTSSWVENTALDAISPPLDVSPPANLSTTPPLDVSPPMNPMTKPIANQNIVSNQQITNNILSKMVMQAAPFGEISHPIFQSDPPKAVQESPPQPVNRPTPLAKNPNNSVSFGFVGKKQDTTTKRHNTAYSAGDIISGAHENKLIHKDKNYIEAALRRMRAGASEIERYVAEIDFSLTKGSYKDSPNKMKSIRACLNIIESGGWRPPSGMY